MSQMKWISVQDKVPPFDHDVIVSSEEGVTRGRRSMVNVVERGEDGLYRSVDKLIEEWGFEINDFESWCKLEVTHWMEFPKPPKLKT